MAATFEFQADTGPAERLAQSLVAGLSPERMDRVVDRVAFEAQRDVVESTKEAIGKGVRWEREGGRWNLAKPEDRWQVSKPFHGARVLRNTDKVANWIEKGNGPEGSYIYPVTAKRLYIPLTRAAAAGWHEGLKYGRDYILVKRVRTLTPKNVLPGVKERADKRLLERARDLIRSIIAKAGGG